eukprot:2609172-Pyramimonas_sp.AAC.1
MGNPFLCVYLFLCPGAPSLLWSGSCCACSQRAAAATAPASAGGPAAPPSSLRGRSSCPPRAPAALLVPAKGFALHFTTVSGSYRQHNQRSHEALEGGVGEERLRHHHREQRAGGEQDDVRHVRRRHDHRG